MNLRQQLVLAALRWKHSIEGSDENHRAAIRSLVDAVTALEKDAGAITGGASKDNTGLPCDECGTKQPRISIWRNEKLFHMQVSFEVESSEANGEIRGFMSLLKGFLR
jgi:hypothetical protein